MTSSDFVLETAPRYIDGDAVFAVNVHDNDYVPSSIGSTSQFQLDESATHRDDRIVDLTSGETIEDPKLTHSSFFFSVSQGRTEDKNAERIE